MKSWRPLVLSGLVLGTFCSSVIGKDAAGNAQESDAIGTARIIHFPKDQSMGRLKIYVGPITDPNDLPGNNEWGNWEFFRVAQGDVIVPVGKIVKLEVSSKDFSPLKKLRPNDLYGLTIDGVQGCIPLNPDRTVMPYLSGLTGLKELEAYNVNISGKGLRHLKHLKSLRTLTIYANVKSLDAGLLFLAKLKSLERLYLGSSHCTDAGLAHLAKLSALKELSLCINKVRGSGLVHLEKLPALRSLILDGDEFTDDGLGYIKNLTSLRKLRLFAPMGKTWSITDAGLAHLSNLTGLEDLELIHISKITDAGMVNLKPLRSLKKLDLRHSQITDAGLAQLKEIKSLESLELPSKNMTDKGLAHLAELDKLKKLIVGSKWITDQGVKHLSTLRSLEFLHVGGEQITDGAMDSVAQLTNLSWLGLGCSQLTDKGLAKLAPLKSLNTLYIWKAKITVSGLAHLNALPNLTSLRIGDIQQDNTVMNISGLTKLEDLTIYPDKNSPIFDQDLACLANLKNLKNLQFALPNEMAISDQGLKYLAGLTNLDTLVIGSNLTDDGLRCLRNMKKLSRLTVYGDFTDKGLGHLEGLKALGILRIYSANDFSQAAVQRLQKSLPNLYDFSADANREIRKKPSRPKIGQRAPAFTLKSLDGKEIKLKDYRGKVVLLYFWATWCSPCVASAPGLKEFYKDLSGHQDFAMISLSMDDDEFKLREFVKQQGFSWPQVRLGNASKVAADYGVTGAPAYFVIGIDGKIVTQDSDWSKLHAAITKALRLSRN